jgi:hypothetical protein
MLYTVDSFSHLHLTLNILHHILPNELHSTFFSYMPKLDLIYIEQFIV